MPETETLDAPSADAGEAPEEATPEEEEALSPLLEAIRQPISEDEPCGGKVTYDEDFQQLKAQINNIESATGEVDYDEIVALAGKILTEKSKDLNAAAYLGLGLTRQQGVAGVAEGIAASRLIVETFWDDLYPAARRMAGRRNALQFLTDRLRDGLDGHRSVEADRAPLTRAQKDLEALQAFCMEAMGEHAPAFSSLASNLKKAIGRLPDLEKEKASEKKAPEQPSAAPGEVQSAAEARQAVTRAVSYLREQEDPDPLPYRLLRVLRWGRLEEEPPHENGATRIEAPLEQRRTYLAGLAAKGEHETLVEEAEVSFQQAPFHFWLDLQRLLDGALEALGEPYAPLREAVREETALLVHRLPGLPALAFRDGTPFADPLTQEWIETQVRPLLSAGGAAAGAPSAGGEEENPLEEQYRTAQQQLAGGDLSGALATLRAGAAGEASPQARFRRRLYAAGLCLNGGRPAVARPLLEGLDEDIARHALDAWDPPLALEVWTQLHTCHHALLRSASNAEKQAHRARADEVFEKLCRLDAAHALSIAGGQGS